RGRLSGGTVLRRSPPGRVQLFDLPQPGLRPDAHGCGPAPTGSDLRPRPGGITGPDGASHHGIWDMAMLRIVPGLRLAAPRDAARLTEELREAVDVTDGPTVLRFPRGGVGSDIPALRRLDDGVDVLREVSAESAADVLIVSVGPFAVQAEAVAERLAGQGISATIVDPRWVLPVPESIIGLAAEHSLVAVL